MKELNGMKLNIKFTALAAVFIAALMLLSPISQTNTSGGGGDRKFRLRFFKLIRYQQQSFCFKR